MKRLTAILVAVVFVLGTMLTPVELFAVETDAQAAETEAQSETATPVETVSPAETEMMTNTESEKEKDE